MTDFDFSEGVYLLPEMRFRAMPVPFSPNYAPLLRKGSREGEEGGTTIPLAVQLRELTHNLELLANHL